MSERPLPSKPIKGLNADRPLPSKPIKRFENNQIARVQRNQPVMAQENNLMSNYRPQSQIKYINASQFKPSMFAAGGSFKATI